MSVPIPSLTSLAPSKETGQPDFRKLRSAARLREADLNINQIETLAFDLFSTAEIDALSVAIINRSDRDGPGTVRDLRLGPRNQSQICEHCSRDFHSCFGHYGRIILPHLFNPLAVTAIIKVLNCVCNSCGGLFVTEADIVREGINRLTGIRRLEAIEMITKKNGGSCRKYQNTAKGGTCQDPLRSTISIVEMETTKDYKLPYRVGKEKIVLFKTPLQVYNILDLISNEDALLLGFQSSHPRNMIIERLIVIPYASRPDIEQENMTLPDDISSMYSEIVRKSNDYYNPGINSSQKEDILKDIYFRVSHLMRNKGGEYKQGTQKSLTDITKRVTGKEGLIRCNIAGKRVNFAGRTVASPGSFLAVDEIGIPKMMAVKLTRPIKVNQLNIAELQARYEANRVTHITPVAGRFAGNRIMITKQFIRENPNYRITIGDVVERILEDGDTVLVNRQPTLNRQSIMALRVKIISERTVMINLSITTPLNADFDGDELNIHVPQTIEAYAEAKQLLSIENSLMNEQNNQPMMTIVYNSLTGAYLLTRDSSTPASRDKYREALDQFKKDSSETNLNILKRIGQEIGLLDRIIFDQGLITVADRPQFVSLRERIDQEGQIWGTGKALASAAFPEDFYYNREGLVIRNGIIVSGTLSKANIGRSQGIISEMIKQLSATHAVNFMTDIQFIANSYIEQVGFTVGLDDCSSDDPAFQELIDKEIEDVQVKVLSLTTSLPSNNRVEAENKERRIINALNVTKSIGDNISIKHLPPTSSLVVMAQSGSKGSNMNIAMITSLLGQLNVNNRRIPANLPGNRTLPIYRPNDDNPTSRGFCTGSFYNGLSPDQLFFQSMATRENLTDTAVNTSRTGQLGNELTKAVQSVYVSPDGAVREAHGNIIQFIYSGDGFYPGSTPRIKIGQETVPFFRDLDQLADKISVKFGY